MNVENDIISFISKAGKIPRNEINLETEIYDSGFVSSLIIIDMIAHIERKYDIVIRPEKLVEDNFRDIKTIAEFVNSLIDIK